MEAILASSASISTLTSRCHATRVEDEMEMDLMYVEEELNTYVQRNGLKAHPATLFIQPLVREA